MTTATIAVTPLTQPQTPTPGPPSSSSANPHPHHQPHHPTFYSRERKRQQDYENYLSEQYLNTRNYFFEKSQILFSLKQNYQRKLEKFKIIKECNKENHRDYYIQVTQLALKDAELRYQRQILLNSEIAWNNQFLEKLSEIHDYRQELMHKLSVYRSNRVGITTLQQRISKITEANRISALNSIVFMNYSKNIVENEMRKSYLINKLYQQRKEMLILSPFYQKLLMDKKKELKDFQINKINIFRRFERILLGKSKEFLEQQQQLSLSAFNFMYSAADEYEEDDEGDGGNNNNNNNTSSSSAAAAAAAGNGLAPTAPVGGKRTSLAHGSGNPRTSMMSRKTQLPLIPVPYGPSPQGDPSDPLHQQNLQEQQDMSSLMYQMMNNTFELGDDDEERNNLTDTLEHRVAQRILVVELPELFPQLQSSLDAAKAMMENGGGLAMNGSEDDAEGGGSGAGGGGGGGNAGNIAALDKNKRNRRLSIVQHGDFVQFVDRFNKTRPNNNNNTSATPEKGGGSKAGKRISSKGSQNGGGGVGGGGSLASGVQEKSSVLSFPDYPANKKKKKKTTTAATSSSNPVVIYDPQDFVESCSGDFLRPNTLIDINKGIGDREERLLKLVDNCCIAKGKVRQLTTIKEVITLVLLLLFYSRN